MNKKDIESLAMELNLPAEVVLNTYKAYWLSIKDTIEALPLKEDITEEQFNKLRCNVNLPSLGKLSCTLDRFLKIKERYNNIKKIKNA